MSSFEIEIREEFLVEGLENLVEVQRLIDQPEMTSNPKAMLEKMFYIVHNLKGGSLSLGFNDVAEFTNLFEALLVEIRKSNIKFSPDIITTLMRSNQRLIEMLQLLQSNFLAKFDNTNFLIDLQRCYALVTNAVE